MMEEKNNRDEMEEVQELLVEIAMKACEARITTEKFLAKILHKKPVHFVIGAVAAMDSMSKIVKAGLDANQSDWQELYDLVWDVVETSAFQSVGPSEGTKTEKDS